MDIRTIEHLKQCTDILIKCLTPCDPQEVELLPAEGLTGSDILLVDLADLCRLSPALGQPVLRGLVDQEAGEQTQAKVDTAQGQEKVWNPRGGDVNKQLCGINSGKSAVVIWKNLP